MARMELDCEQDGRTGPRMEVSTVFMVEIDFYFPHIKYLESVSTTDTCKDEGSPLQYI